MMPKESTLIPEPTLTPRQQETVNKFIKLGDMDAANRWKQEFLKGNAEDQTSTFKPVTPPDTLDMTIPWSEGETIVSRPITLRDRLDAKTAASQKLQQDLIRQGYTGPKARELASAKLGAIENRIVDIEGRSMTGQGLSIPASKKKVEELEGFEAIKEAFKPQQLLSSEQSKAVSEHQAEIMRTRDIKMKDIESRLPSGLSPVERRNKVEALYKDDIQSAKPKIAAYAREHYKEIVGKDPESPNDPELLGLKMYDDYVSDYAPSLKATTGWDKAKKAASESLMSHLTSKDPVTGAISENYFGTAARDIGGLWRFVLDPVEQALTYEVDDQGRPIRKDDVGFIPAQRTKVITSGTEEGRPVASDSESYLKDVAVSVAKGRSLGDDLMDITMESSAKDNSTIPYWIGMAGEIALPLSPLGAIGDVVSGASKGAARVADTAGLRAIATGLRAVSEPMEAVRTATAKGLSKAALSEVADAERAIKDIDALGDAHSVRATTARIIAEDAVKMSEEMKSLPDAGSVDIGSIRHPLLKKAAQSLVDAGQPITRNSLERATREVSSIPMKQASSLLRSIDNIASAGPDSRLTILKKQLYEASQEGISKGLGEDAAVEYGTQKVIADVLSEHFLNAVPDDMIFITPTTVVTRKAWKQVGKDVVSKVRSSMDATPIQVGGETHFKIKSPIAIRDGYLQDVITIPRSSFWDTVIQKLDTEAPLTQAEYLEVYNKVLAKETLAATVAAKDLKYTGLAAEKAAVPVERRIPILRSAQDLYRGVSQAIQGVKADSFMAKLNPRSPLLVKNMVEEIKGLSARITDSFTSELKVAEGATPLERFENTIKGWSGSTSSVDDWEDFINQYFAGGTGLSTEQIRRIVGTGKRIEKSADVVDVLRAVREENQTLKGVGYKQRGIKATFDKTLGRADQITDDIFAAQTVFAVGRRQKAQVANAIRNLLDKNPELGYLLRDVNYTFTSPTGTTLRANINGILSNMGVAPANIDIIRPLITKIYEGMSSDSELISRLVSDKITEGSIYAGNWEHALNITQTDLDALRGSLMREFGEASFHSPKTDNAFNEILSPIRERVFGISDNIADNMTHWGIIDETGSIERSLKHLQPELMNIKTSDMIPMIGKDLAKEITDIQDAIKSGAFSKNMSSLIVKDSKALSIAWRSVWDFIKSSRSVMVGGMLGGNWIPNFRFLVNNLVTAPLIMNITTGIKATSGSTMRLVGDLLPKIMNKSVPDATVIFKDSLGRSWTKAALSEMLERNNIKFSQSTFEFAESDIESIRRSAMVAADKAGLKDATTLQNLSRWWDPRNKSLYNVIGEGSDNLWRQSAFLNAIKSGKTELEAAEMARNSMLDYSKVTPQEREVLGQFVMFYAFRRQMTMEVLQSIARNPNDLRRLMILHKEQQKRQHLWEFAPVYAQTRFLGFNKDKIWDDTMAGSYGPGDPAMSAFSDILMAIGAVTRGNIGEMIEGLKGEVFTPELGMAGSMADTYSMEKGTGYVPPAQVNALMELGLWQDFVNIFHVEPIPYVNPDYRRQGEPTFKQKSSLTSTGLSKIGLQYRFADAQGYNRYLALVYALTRLGLMRSMNDVATTGLISGITPDGVTRKRFEGGPTSGALYTLGLDTPMKIDTDRSAEIRAQQKALKDLKDLAKP